MGDHHKIHQEFIKVLLQWDYAAMFGKYQEGGGLVDELPDVPKKFSNYEVQLCQARRCAKASG
jgi:hypothetical protein